MALPILDKTWIFKTNNYIRAGIDASTCYRNILLHLKQSLTDGSIGGWTDNTGAPVTNAHPWTVISSSNGTSAGLGDNWNTTADIVADATRFSWVVLRQPAVNPLYEISFGLSLSTNLSLGSVYVAPNLGFDLTGLVTTAYPGDLGDRIALLSGASYDGTANAIHDLTLHYMMSTDGECTCVFGFYANTVTLIWILAKPKNPIVGWPSPSISFVSSSGPTYANLNTNLNIKGRGLNNTVLSAYGSTEYYNTGPAGSVLAMNPISGEWPIWPIGLITNNTSGMRGFIGYMYDLWYTSYLLKAGTTMPSSGTRQFAVIGNLLVPWNNSVMLTQ
jgi:hypothetical protein